MERIHPAHTRRLLESRPLVEVSQSADPGRIRGPSLRARLRNQIQPHLVWLPPGTTSRETGLWVRSGDTRRPGKHRPRTSQQDGPTVTPEPRQVLSEPDSVTRNLGSAHLAAAGVLPAKAKETPAQGSSCDSVMGSHSNDRGQRQRPTLGPHRRLGVCVGCWRLTL